MSVNGIFAPGNEDRSRRLDQLAADASEYVKSGNDLYARFKALTVEVNDKIAALYKSAGLSPPKTTMEDLLKGQGLLKGINVELTTIEITELVASLSALVFASSVLAPAVTSALISSGAMTSAMAGEALVVLLGMEITAGSFVGGIVAGVVTGIVVTSTILIADLVKDLKDRKKLRHGIYNVYNVRTDVKLATDKTRVFVDALASINSALDSIKKTIPITDEFIKNLIDGVVTPSIETFNKITKDKVLADLSAIDLERKSWTKEDLKG